MLLQVLTFSQEGAAFSQELFLPAGIDTPSISGKSVKLLMRFALPYWRYLNNINTLSWTVIQFTVLTLLLIGADGTAWGMGFSVQKSALAFCRQWNLTFRKGCAEKERVFNSRQCIWLWYSHRYAAHEWIQSSCLRDWKPGCFLWLCCLGDLIPNEGHHA